MTMNGNANGIGMNVDTVLFVGINACNVSVWDRGELRR